jgi:hypothetical protein
MPSAAWLAQVKISGTAVVTTGEATTSLGGGQYQITNTAKRVLDPSVAVVVKDTGTPVSSTLWSIDKLFGVVTFSGYTPTGAVTVDASYLPTATIAECRALNIKTSADLADVSVLESQGKKKQATLIDFEGSLDRLAIPLDDLDAVTGGTQSVDSLMKSGTPKLLDVLFTAGARFRGWVLFSGYDVKSEVAGVVTVSVKFNGASQGAGASFGWGA